MRTVIDLKNKIKDRTFFLSQFEQSGPKNILFVSPMLSGKHLYNSLLPHLLIDELTACKTAVTNLGDYDMDEQLYGLKSTDIRYSPDCDLMIRWATHIVFPFSLQPLSSVYERIRSTNPSCKIIYSVDFNYYETPKKHPLFEAFDEERVITYVEDNMFFSDIVLVNNAMLQSYLIEKLTSLVQAEYVGVFRGSIFDEIKILLFPQLMNEKLVMENVEYDASGILFKVPSPESPEKEVTLPGVKKDIAIPEKKIKLAASKPKTKPMVVKKPKAVIKKKGKKK
jgi:hypothetical protein